jgi:hypothetical protein
LMTIAGVRGDINVSVWSSWRVKWAVQRANYGSVVRRSRLIRGVKIGIRRTKCALTAK